MNELHKRSVEFSIQNNYRCVLLATTPFSKICEDIEDIFDNKFKDKYNVNYYKYDISTDEDMMEKYKIFDECSILIFKNGNFVKKFNSDELDKFEEYLKSNN